MAPILSNMTFEQIKFGGRIHSIAEDELCVSLTEDKDSKIVSALWIEYESEGKPKNLNAWIKSRLQKLFIFATNPPQWIEGRPTWPFHKGQPMVFISQLDVPKTQTVEEKLCEDHTLYLFGIRDYEEDGFRMVYRVVSQNHQLKKLT